MSRTFHGRDIFAPVAGHITRGVPLEAFGPAVTDPVRLPQAHPTIDGDQLNGRVVFIDRFGNALTNLTSEAIARAFGADAADEAFDVRLLDRRVGALARSYGDAPVGIERFRPNLVLAGVEAHDEDRLAELRVAAAGGEVRLRPVKPCTHCPIPNIDPASAASSPEVLETLSAYRADPRLDGALTFCMNAIILAGVGQTLRVGDAVAGDWKF